MLQVVYGEIVSLDSRVNALNLSHFILHRLLSNPDISAQFAHPSVPHCYTNGA